MVITVTVRRRVAALLTVCALIGITATALAQRRRGGFGGFGGFAGRPMPTVPNAPYDGRFNFVRVK